MQELVSPSGTAGFLPPGHLLSTSPALEQLDVEVLGYVSNGSKWRLQSLVIYVLLLKDRLGWAHFRIHPEFEGSDQFRHGLELRDVMCATGGVCLADFSMDLFFEGL